MKTPRKASPARSQGPLRTPIRHKPRRTLSVTSARSSASVIISALTQQRKKNASFVVSPLGSRKSILSDNTEIEDPRRKSWWKNLGDNSTTSRDMELVEENGNLEPNNFIEELDMEIVSQENKKNYTLELPESSDGESINSIVITQRKLFPQREHQDKHFTEIMGTRESLAKQNETVVDKTLVTGTRKLFQNKQRTRPIFPAALLNISLNQTAAEKTPKAQAQVRNIFGQRDTKRKNIFSNFNNFIVTESEDEIPDIQPKIFGFRKTIEASRRSSLHGIREPSPASSITTDMEMDDWKMLPSSTMVENQIEVLMTGQTPKRGRLSNLAERESEAGSNTSKQSNKSNSSKKDKSRKSKTYTKEKSQGIDLEEIVECDHETAGNIDKSRKSKTFTKEKAQGINPNENVECDYETAGNIDKSRKSKSFTKVNACEYDTDYDMIKKSKTLEDENEYQNKSMKDTTKSRKSKTFIKDIVDLETSRTTRNKSKVQPDDKVENNSKTKISEHNISTNTRSQSKNTSPNNSQVIKEAYRTSQTTDLNKTTSCFRVIENVEKDNPDEEENNDEELNFSLHYETEDEEVPETQNKSITSKIITPKNAINADSSKEDECLPKKVKESAEFESSQSKNISKGENIQSNHEQSLHASGNDFDRADNVQLEQKSMNRSKNISQEIENEGERKNESEVAADEVDKASDNEEENGKPNKSQAADESDNEDEQEQYVQQKEADNASDHEKHDLSLKQNQNEPENESQEVDDDNEENQNEMHTESDAELNESQVHNENDTEQNESQVQNESYIQDESQEVEEDNDEANNASDHEKHDLSLEQNQNEPENESQEVDDDNEENQNEMHTESDAELNESQVQNETDTEQNESQVQNESYIEDESQEVEEDNDEEQEEQDSDAEQNESDNQDGEQNVEDSRDNSQDKGVDSEIQEESVVDDILETPNVSHDTTGRNRKKDKSPEAVLHDSRNLDDSLYSVKGDKTVRKTEMLKSTHRDLVPARESAGFSDGSSSSAQGSGWDSHRTTRKTLRQTYGRDFTPRKSLRALVMEKYAKRQTQHNEIASVTGPLFPQANSTEIPSAHSDDEDETRPPNDISLRTRQTTIEKHLMEVAKVNAERRKKIEEKVLKSLKEPPTHNIFKIPVTPLFPRPPKPKQSKTAMRAAKITKLFGGEVPEELLKELMYKPPKRYQPKDAPWATKHLYKLFEEKLEPKYKYKSRVRAERLMETLYKFTKELRRCTVAPTDAVEDLKLEMARLRIVKTHHEFYEFFGKFMPRDVRRKVMPDLINNIELPRQGVFSDIL